MYIYIYMWRESLHTIIPLGVLFDMLCVSLALSVWLIANAHAQNFIISFCHKPKCIQITLVKCLRHQMEFLAAFAL